MTSGYTKVFFEIADSLNITRGTNESIISWMERIIYSAAGRVALFSLYDHLELEEPISIIHFKNKARREITALCAAGNITSLTNSQCQDICDEIYDEYIKAGYIYHFPNRIEPVPDKIVSGKFVKFIRGATFDKRIKTSGLGYYFLLSDEEKIGHPVYTTCDELYEMFHINHIKLDDYYKKLTERRAWQLFQVTSNVEYLRMSSPFTRGYWSPEPTKNGDISLLRVGQQGERIYYLYKYENTSLYASILPEWMTSNYEYRQIAVCLLDHIRKLPESDIQVNGNLVYFNIGYLYPPSIQNLLMLYSWPNHLNNVKSAFSRIMNRQVWESIRIAIEPLGYKFREEIS